MTKPKVFVTRIIPEVGLKKVLEFCDADVWLEELPPSYEVMLKKVKGVEGVLSLLTDRIDGQLMDTAGSSLKVISNHAVGYDNIDIPAATQRNLPVGNTPGILTNATADFAFALLMAAARRIVEGDRYVREGKWKTWGPSTLLGPDITGGTLGLIGYGRIGKAVAKRAKGFDMRVIYFDPSAKNEAENGVQSVDIDTVLRESDFVSLHTPLTPQTKYFINRDFLKKMKPTAVLINTSRGQVIDQHALYDALKNRTIAAAALDVTDPEPLPLNSPLLQLDNLIIAPHIASASKTTRDKMALMAAENLIAGVKGEPLPNCVNPEVYKVWGSKK